MADNNEIYRELGNLSGRMQSLTQELHSHKEHVDSRFQAVHNNTNKTNNLFQGAMREIADLKKSEGVHHSEMHNLKENFEKLEKNQAEGFQKMDSKIDTGFDKLNNSIKTLQETNTSNKYNIKQIFAMTAGVVTLITMLIALYGVLK